MKKYLLLLAFVLGVGYAHAAALPDTTKQEILENFSGGLNTTDPSHKLDNKYSPYMRNVFIDNGKIERVNGYVTLGSSRTLAKVTGIFPFVRETGQTTFLVTDSSLTLETSDFKNWTFVSSNSNSGAILYWMQVRNKMWGFNGVNSIMTWDGTSKVILDGTLGTPNVPKFRYGAYYQDRVWGFSIPNSASDLYFSATIATDATIIAPDNFLAWPTVNAVYCGRGDGQLSTALWVYQGLLRAGKEQSIYTIYGDQPSNYNPRKEEANVGVVSHESVRVMDGQSHFLGQTGVYRNVLRVSDLIDPDINSINKGVTNILTNTWDTQTDFLRGQVANSGISATPDGFVTVSTTDVKMNWGTALLAVSSNPTGFLEFSSTQNQSTDFAIRIPTDTPPTSFLGYFGGGPSTLASLFYRCVPSGPGPTMQLIFLNTRTGNTITSNANAPCSNIAITGADTLAFPDGGSRLEFTADDIANSRFRIQVTTIANMTAGQIFQFYPTTRTLFSDLSYLFHYATAQYISDVATLTSVTAWGNFDSVRNTNGGNINYYYRTSTSVVNITTQTWKNISPGSIISDVTINKFIQWASTLQSVGSTPPNIDNVQISHIEGQASDARAFAMDWQNRYWLGVTTTSDYTRRLIYVKSKITNAVTDAWMPVEIPVNCFAKSGNVFYGGAVSTGVVYRLDYGTNFDGAAINSIYDTPDMSLGSYFFDKDILKYIIDGDKSTGGDMSVASSINQRSFTSSTFTITGSGRYIHVIEGVTKPVKTLRLRLQNMQTDIGLGINNVNILYEPTQKLSNQ